MGAFVGLPEPVVEVGAVAADTVPAEGVGVGVAAGVAEGAGVGVRAAPAPG